MYHVSIWQQALKKVDQFTTFQSDLEYLDEYRLVEHCLFDSEDAAADWLLAKAEQQTLSSLKHLCFTCEEVNAANVIGNLHTNLGDV